MNLKKLGFSKTAAHRVSNIKAGILMLGVLVGIGFSITANAQPTSPCDPQYMDALEARAWLEAQREITQNKNLIYKPDSVLEYTCFDRFLNEAASNFGNRQFSETNHWGGTQPATFSTTSTDTALTNVVLQPMTAYLTRNFNSTGNMGDYLNNRLQPGYTPAGTVSGGTAYTCDEMQRVWLAARCMNFNPTPENANDGFFDFAYYQSRDVRQESNAWALMCTTADPRITTARQAAFNNDQALFDVTNELGNIAQGDGTPYLEDDIITHLNFILPGSCPLAVPTGISVQRPDLNGGAAYNEYVCTNPGCSNTPGSATCTP